MCLSRTMAGLASATLPSFLGVELQVVMRILGETVRNVFMTDLAGVRTRVAGRKRGLGRPANNRQERD